MSFSCADIGISTATLAVTDAAGNTATCTSVITIADQLPPVAVCRNLTQSLSGSSVSVNAQELNNGSSDNCTLAANLVFSGTGLTFDCANLGANTVTLNVTDALGNTGTCTSVITIEDKTAPTATCKNLTVALDGSGMVSVAGTALNNNSSDNCTTAGTLSFLPVSTSFGCQQIGANTIVLTVTDGSGNTATCSSVVTVQDVTAPMAKCKNIQASLDNTGVVNISSALLNDNSTDNCTAGASLTLMPASITYQCSDVGQHTVTLTVTDASLNTATCTSVVTVTETIPPVASCRNLSLSLDFFGQISFSAYQLNQNSTDNCTGAGLLEYSASVTSFICDDIGNNVVVLTVFDVSGNLSTCTSTVTILDDIAPNAGCLSQTVHLDNAGNTVIPAFMLDDNSSDNCTQPADLVFSPLQVEYSCADIGPNTVTLTVTDSEGNSSTCTAVLQVTDSTAPEIVNCPDNAGVSDCIVLVPDMQAGLEADDNCGVMSIEQVPPAGSSQDDLGQGNTVTFIVTDEHGNTATCTAIVLVNDIVPPVFTNCPGDVTLENNPGTCARTFNVTLPVATDNCSSATVIQTDGLSGMASFPVGTTTQIFEATDAASNTATCVYTVTVEDTEAPHPHCQSAFLNLGSDGTVTVTGAELAPTSTDNCTAPGMLVFEPAFITYECADVTGQHVVVVQATDEAGNSWTCVSTVIVSDNLPPVITTCPANVIVNDCNALIPDLTAQLLATDNCEIASVEQFPAAGSEQADLGPDRVISFLVTDQGSNTTTCSAKLSVEDGIPPVFISCPDNLTIGNDYEECGAVFFMDDPEATDNCTEVTVIQTQGLAWNTFFPIGVTTQLFEATDSAGNTAICIFTVTVEDIQSPTVFCTDQTVYLSPMGTAEILAVQIDGGAYDNCTFTSDLEFIPSSYQFDCTDAGERSVTLRVRDEAGNIDSCFALITVLDINGPVITNCPQTHTLNSCSGGMPDLTQLVTATDVCGVAEITQDPQVGTDLLPLFGNSTSLTFVVSDYTGNTNSCQTVLQITDSTPPAFQNCPTATVFVSNLPGLCGTVLTWTVPTASDDCTQATVVKISGPDQNAVVSVNCPPTIETIVYRATDTSGNSSTCSFNIAAVDTEQPVINPLATALDEVDIECNQVEPDCVIRASGQCIPISSSDVTDNCTGPVNLTITVAETSSKGSNPANCDYYNYTLIRTWTVTDCAGNSTVFTQKINVHDTTAPAAVCKNETVSLGGSGEYTLGLQDLDAGSYDNCAIGSRLSFQLSNTNFNCDNIGDNLIVMTVKDPCGNTDTCHAILTILEGSGKCNPVYDPVGSETCICLDNATTATNGQFGEIIQMEAKVGLALTVKTSTGLFMPNSPAPPAVPVPVPNGALLLAGVSDGIDNDHDNTTDEPDENTWYTLRARHVEGIGFTAVIRASNGDEVALSNKCFYPEPKFVGLSDTLCLGTPAFDIEVEEASGADGTVTNTRVNGSPATQVNAAQLGAGTHQVQSTFDAGSARPYRVVDGVALDGTEAQAKSDPGCQYRLSKSVVVLPAVSVVSCKDTVTVHLDTICEVTLTGEDVLLGTYRCPEDFLVNIDRVSPPGNGPWSSPDIDSSDIGNTYGYRLVDVITGTTKCSGIVKVRNDQPPVLICPDDITIGCSEPFDIAYTGDVEVEYCLSVTKTVEDIFTENDFCENPRRLIQRRFKIVDNQGRQTSCEQKISVAVINLSDIVFPDNITLSCDDNYGNPDATSPSSTGAPSINGYPVSESTLCDVLVTYDETRYESCGGSYGILRNWQVLNRCLPISPTNPRTDTQRIEVKDEGGPRFDCPTVATVSVDSAGCCSTNGLAPLIVSEGCSGIIDLVANVVAQNPQQGVPPLFTVTGFLVDFPGNNHQLADTMAVFPYLTCLPNGSSYIVTCTASDSCGNTSSCQYELKIGDLIEPVAKCSSFTQVNLPVSGTQTLTAVSFNNGSADNCAGTSLGFKIRRTQGNACEPAIYFDDDIKLCCADIGDTVQAIVRVYDLQVPSDTVSATAFDGHYTDCQTRIFVTELNKPVCTPPADATVACSDFNGNLSVYGQAMVADECCVDTVIVLANYSQFDTSCTRGTITRTFRVLDCAGNQAQCTQQIIVNYLQDYYIRFPDDVIITNCSGAGNFGEPAFFGVDCENMVVTHEDEISNQVPDACYRINRRWTILNGCTYDSTITCINVPNPTPEAVINHPLNLLGPIVSPLQTQGDPWKSTVLKITTGSPQATNFSVFYSTSANCYTYTQTIKVSDDQAPVPVYPVSDTIRDLTLNDSLMWNAPYWWNSNSQMEDLCEAPSDISISVTDSCSGTDLDIKYILYLDLDGNGTTESFIDSEELGAGGLGWNTVLYGNGTGPGDPRAFDNRPVSSNQKWGFAYQEEVSGQQVIARVRFNTQADQNTFADPMLPHGSHRIRWIIRDGCGNDTICDYPLIIRDGVGPVLVCRDSVVVVLNSTGEVAVQAVSLLVSATDNCSRLDDLELAFRLCGFGNGFPINQWGQPASADTFGCINRGVFCVEAWALDPAGNSSNCETQLMIRDFNNVCPGGPNINLTGMIKTEIGRGVGVVNVRAEGSNGVTGMFNYSDMTDTLGNYEIVNQIPRGSDFLITPSKNINHLNGITTYDLVLISRHILGVAPLGSPYRLIAADANRSNSVTTFDIVEFRKLILGIYQTIPNNTSWRFIDAEQVFTNPLNPFLDSIHERVFVDSALFNRNINFVGVKIGDVNASTEPGNAVSPDDRTFGTLFLDVEDREVQPGEVFNVTFRTDVPSGGYQFTMNLSDVDLTAIPPSGRVTENNFGVFSDAVTASIDGSDEFTLTFTARNTGKLSEMLGLSNRITRSIGYDVAGNPLEMALRFDEKTVSEVGFELYQNVPNPFSRRTSIGFNLPEAGPATLQVYDQTGRLIFSQTASYPKGYNSVLLDGNLTGKPGVLFYQLKTEKQTATRKMIRQE
ncbi:MAG: HYR domain-containing protein [Bacteroidota bacterium]